MLSVRGAYYVLAALAYCYDISGTLVPREHAMDRVKVVSSTLHGNAGVSRSRDPESGVQLAASLADNVSPRGGG